MLTNLTWKSMPKIPKEMRIAPERIHCVCVKTLPDLFLFSELTNL